MPDPISINFDDDQNSSDQTSPHQQNDGSNPQVTNSEIEQLKTEIAQLKEQLKTPNV